MDIYHSYIHRDASERQLVHIGRWASSIALFVAVVIAPMLTGLDQAFQYIQAFTGFVSPGALAIFLAGFFYPRATSRGALLAAVGSFVFSVLMKAGCPSLPWMDRMGIVFLLCCAVMVVTGSKSEAQCNACTYERSLFATNRWFNISAVIIMAILVGIYWLWW